MASRLSFGPDIITFGITTQVDSYNCPSLGISQQQQYPSFPSNRSKLSLAMQKAYSSWCTWGSRVYITSFHPPFPNDWSCFPKTPVIKKKMSSLRAPAKVLRSHAGMMRLKQSRKGKGTAVALFIGAHNAWQACTQRSP